MTRDEVDALLSYIGVINHPGFTNEERVVRSAAAKEILYNVARSAADAQDTASLRAHKQTYAMALKAFAQGATAGEYIAPIPSKRGRRSYDT